MSMSCQSGLRVGLIALAVGFLAVPDARSQAEPEADAQIGTIHSSPQEVWVDVAADLSHAWSITLATLIDFQYAVDPELSYLENNGQIRVGGLWFVVVPQPSGGEQVTRVLIGSGDDTVELTDQLGVIAGAILGVIADRVEGRPEPVAAAPLGAPDASQGAYPSDAQQVVNNYYNYDSGGSGSSGYVPYVPPGATVYNTNYWGLSWWLPSIYYGFGSPWCSYYSPYCYYSPYYSPYYYPWWNGSSWYGGYGGTVVIIDHDHDDGGVTPGGGGGPFRGVDPRVADLDAVPVSSLPRKAYDPLAGTGRTGSGDSVTRRGSPVARADDGAVLGRGDGRGALPPIHVVGTGERRFPRTSPRKIIVTTSRPSISTVRSATVVAMPAVRFSHSLSRVHTLSGAGSQGVGRASSFAPATSTSGSGLFAPTNAATRLTSTRTVPTPRLPTRSTPSTVSARRGWPTTTVSRPSTSRWHSTPNVGRPSPAPLHNTPTVSRPSPVPLHNTPTVGRPSPAPRHSTPSVSRPSPAPRHSTPSPRSSRSSVSSSSRASHSRGSSSRGGRSPR